MTELVREGETLTRRNREVLAAALRGKAAPPPPPQPAADDAEVEPISEKPPPTGE